jgi:hypothetical protein
MQPSYTRRTAAVSDNVAVSSATVPGAAVADIDLDTSARAETGEDDLHKQPS